MEWRVCRGRGDFDICVVRCMDICMYVWCYTTNDSTDGLPEAMSDLRLSSDQA